MAPKSAKESGGVGDVHASMTKTGTMQKVCSSPTHIAATRLNKAQAASLPPILLIHGRRDTTVPCTASIAYGRALKAAGAEQGVGVMRSYIAEL